MPSADSGIFDENIVERCDFAMSRCQSDDNWNTLQRRQLEHAAHSHTNTQTHTHTHKPSQSYSALSASIRMRKQPFASAGDIFVYTQSELCFHAFRSFYLRAPCHFVHT